MKEYWVNVYDGAKSAVRHYSRENAIKAAYVVIPFKCIYRIHVKIKEVKPKYELSEYINLISKIYS